MAEKMELFDLLLGWIVANPIFSSIAAIVIAGTTVYAKTIVQAIAKKHSEKFWEKKDSEDEVFDEPFGAVLQNRTNEALNELTSEDLISLYGKKNLPFNVRIASTHWSFAASRTLDPIIDGAIEKQKIPIQFRLVML